MACLLEGREGEPKERKEELLNQPVKSLGGGELYFMAM